MTADTMCLSIGQNRYHFRGEALSSCVSVECVAKSGVITRYDNGQVKEIGKPV